MQLINIYHMENEIKLSTNFFHWRFQRTLRSDI